MSGVRDIVRFLPNERVDVGDAEAIQRNVLSDHRSQMAALLFGSETTPANLQKVIDGFTVAEDSGGPSSQIEIVNGAAIAATNLPDATLEYGVIFGREVQTLQTLDFTGQPAMTYSIYIRFSDTPGKIGTRVFWNAVGNDEDVDAIETRYVTDWDVVFSTTSPGNEYIKIAQVVWDGVSIDNADISDYRDLIFEGAVDGSFAHTWGDGANDRNTARGTYGVMDLATWIAAVRRQLDDIIGGSNGWFDAVTTGLNPHTADSTDPHGTLLTQTDLELTNLLNADDLVLWNDNTKTQNYVATAICAFQDFWAGWDQTLYPLANIELKNNFDSQGTWAVVGLFTSGQNSAQLAGKIEFPGASGAGLEITGMLTKGRLKTSGGNDVDCTIRLIQKTRASGAESTLATQTLVPSSGDFSTAWTGGPWSIDTATYWYFFELDFDLDPPGAAGSELGIYHIEVYFEKSRIDTPG